MAVIASSHRLRALLIAWVLVLDAALPQSGWAQATPSPEEEPPSSEPETTPETEASDQPTEGEVAAEAEASATAEAAAEATPARSATPEGEDIVVTGSRLKRTSFDAPSPVQVVDRATLAKTGASNMRDVVAALPVNYGAENNAGIGVGARGTAQFNLHGLGPGATLVLLNGRRIIRTGLTVEGQPFDDVTQIPLSMVERVEVMKGGASAIYGSDAVAGVVNVITRRKYNGLEIQMGGNLATRTGGLRDGEVALTLGSSSDTSGIGITMVYYDRTALLGHHRTYSQGDPGLPQVDFSMPLPATGIPFGNARPTNLSQQGNPASFVFQLPPAMAGGMMTYVTQPDPLCLSPAARAAGSYQQGNNCGFDFTQYYNYVYPEKRINVYSTMEHDFTPHFSGFAEVGYMRQTIENPLSPSFSLSKGLYVPKDHPDIPAELQANAMMATPVGGIRISGRTRGGDYGGMHQTTRVDNFRLVAGVRGNFEAAGQGSFVEDWDWELSGTYQDYQFLDRSTDDLTENLQRSLNACSPMSADNAATNNGIQQVPCFHPFYAQRTLNLTDRNNAVNQTANEYIEGEVISLNRVTMAIGDAMLRGTLADLPGGRLGFAVGAQVRHNSIYWKPDRDGQLQRYVFLIGVPHYRGSNDIVAGYGELGAPLLKGLEVQGALRFEHYSNVGSSTNPKLGLSYSPFVGSDSKALAGIHLRGAYATSFRGPSLFQTNGKQVQLSQFIVGTAAVFRPQTTVGNPELKPETSTAINAGLDWNFGGLSLETEYWRFTYDEQVVKEDGTARWARQCQPLITASPMVDPNTIVAMNPVACKGVQLSTDGQLQGVNVGFVNAGEVVAHGIDLSANFRFGEPESFGVFSLGGNLSYLLSYKTKDNPALPAVERSGWRNVTNFAPSLPKVHLSVPVGWSLAGHTLGVTGKFISSYLNDQDPSFNRTVMPPMLIPNSGALIPSWFTVDMQYSFRTKEFIGTSTTFSVGAINVLDADPPWVYTNLGYDGTQHDARGRMLYGRLTQEF